MEPAILRALASILLATVRMYQNGHAEAVALLRVALDDAAGNVPVLVQVLLRLSFAQNSIGEFDDARRHVRDAVKLAEELGVPGHHQRGAGLVGPLNFQWGDGLDEPSLQRALELYDHSLDRADHLPRTVGERAGAVGDRQA